MFALIWGGIYIGLVPIGIDALGPSRMGDSGQVHIGDIHRGIPCLLPAHLGGLHLYSIGIGSNPSCLICRGQELLSITGNSVGKQHFAGVLPFQGQRASAEFQQDNTSERIRDLVHPAGGIIGKCDLVAESVGHMSQTVIGIEKRLLPILIAHDIGIIGFREGVIVQWVILKPIFIFIDCQGKAVLKVDKGSITVTVILHQNLLDGGEHKPPTIS